MKEMMIQSTFFGAFISLAFYELGLYLKKKTGWSILNPLLVSVILTIVCLLFLDMDYESYFEGAKYISYLLTPATVCLAIPLYEQFQLLKKNLTAVLAGIVSGVLTSALVILALSMVFGLDHAEYVTFLPKSITTAIGMVISEQLGGYVAISVAAILVTGIAGNLLAEPVYRLFRVEEPIAKGVGLGTSAHAIGTSKALEMGEIEGAMGGLSIAVAGILTVLAASLFAGFY